MKRSLAFNSLYIYYSIVFFLNIINVFIDSKGLYYLVGILGLFM